MKVHNTGGSKCVEVSFCPVCEAGGSLKYENCGDQFLNVPGRWSYFECVACYSLWMNPRPTVEYIPTLYPSYYTHKEPVSMFGLHSLKGFSGARFWVNLYILRKFWAYGNLNLNTAKYPVRMLGRALAVFPGVQKRAGSLIRYIKAKPGGRLLDVGCGNGSFLLSMKALGWIVQGVELDELAVAAARSAGLNVEVGDVSESGLPLGGWDAITLNHVIEHLTDPVEAIRLLSKRLAPGGTLAILAPNPRSLNAMIFSKNWFNLDPPRHLVLPSPEGYAYMLAKLGLNGEVFTSNNMAASSFEYSMSYKSYGRIKSEKVGILSRMIRYFLYPLIICLAPSAGEEVVCIIRCEK